jgi:hypothetical protein
MMKQNQWQILFFIMIFLTIYVLFSPEMYNSILGRSVVVFTIVLLTKYNIMLGLGLVLVAIYMYPDANYMSYMEGMTDSTTSTTDPTTTSTAPSTTTPSTTTPSTTTTPTTAPSVTATPTKPTDDTIAAKKEEIKTSGSGTATIQQELAKHANTITNGLKQLGIATPEDKPTEAFTENKKYSGTTDRIAKEERLRPKSSVTPQLYQGRGNGVSTNSFQEPSPNSQSNGLGFAFLS